MAVQKLIRSFSHLQFEHVLRAQDKRANALAIFAFKIDVLNEAVDVRIIKRNLQATVDLISVNPIDEQDWQNSYHSNLKLVILNCDSKG